MVLALARSFQELERASALERERAEQLSSILDAIAEPLLVIDSKCRPIRWNQAGSVYADQVRDPRVTEWPDLYGLHHADQATLYDWRELPLVRAALGESVDDQEICVRDGGEARWISVTARPVRGVDPETHDGAVAVLRDVTQAKRAQENQIVNDRMVSIGVLAAGIAHEINNPMTSVLAELDMAIEDLPEGDPSAERMRAARDAALRVTTIVRDLKTLSRGGANDELALVDLRRVIDAAVRMAAPETRTRATVTVEIDSMPRVFANEARLVQVLLNLLVNAAQSIAQAARDRGESSVRHPAIAETATDTIHVSGGTGRDGGALIAIADTGTGMTPEVRARLFTPFFTTKPVGAGTGLGLSISHRIIVGLGGTIECDSTPDLGTVFRVWIPAPADSGQTELGTRGPSA
jgi:two-component system NtrC family sensor kinase